MFDVGWSEMLIVGALALIVVGPKDLPRMMRSVGNFVRAGARSWRGSSSAPWKTPPRKPTSPT